MRVVAITVWFNEDPDHLAKLALSLAGFADGLVAVDGAYRYFPNGAARSRPEEAIALIEGCDHSGVELVLHQPNRLWEGEVAKRNTALRLARSLNPDWVVIVDGDTEIGYHEGVRDALAKTKFDVALTRMVDDESVANRQWCNIRNVFRYSDDLEWWRTHYMVRKGEKLLFCPLPANERLALQLPPLASACSLRYLTMIHHPKRGYRRSQALKSYEERDRIGIETPAG